MRRVYLRLTGGNSSRRNEELTLWLGCEGITFPSLWVRVKRAWRGINIGHRCLRLGNRIDDAADVLGGLRVSCGWVGNDVYLGSSGVTPASAAYEESDEESDENGAEYGSNYNANTTFGGRGVSIEAVTVQLKLQESRGSK